MFLERAGGRGWEERGEGGVIIPLTTFDYIFMSRWLVQEVINESYP